jgi:hypothetical protein
MKLVQLLDSNGARRMGTPTPDGRRLRLFAGIGTVYELARLAAETSRPLADLVAGLKTDGEADYDAVAAEKRLLPPIDHPDPARCVVTLTGLTHLASAQSRAGLHAVSAADMTDSMKMYQLGVEGGKPGPGRIGAQPEWAYKGDGRCIVPPEHPLISPGFADDAGEEAEIAGVYLIDGSGRPRRVGYALGNEFADHAMEKKNYLYLAHSKLRPCSFGPELLLGELPPRLAGTVRIVRGSQTAWSSPFRTGEAEMAHSLANLEHHHFKYSLFRRPGDLHVHFFGASATSFGAGFAPQPGDIFEISIDAFGRPLRNPLKLEARPESPLKITPL